MTPPNPKHPEQRARRQIDAMLTAAGWAIQDRKDINLAAAPGVAVREFYTKGGPADYLLFLGTRLVGVIEAKKAGVTLTSVEAQTRDYAAKVWDRLQVPVRPLPFLYESTGVETWFTNGLDPDAQARRVFAFHRPETLQEWLDAELSRQAKRPGAPAAPTLKGRMRLAPPLNSAGISYEREDFWASTTNKQLNFVQHVKSLLDIQHFTLKTNPMKRADLDDFVARYKPGSITKRKPTWSDSQTDGRWRVFACDELVARDKCSLDLFWLKDDSLLDADSLPEPDVIAQEIADDLRSALEQIAGILGDLETMA